jgi:AcrR family transcriptional regulator
VPSDEEIRERILDATEQCLLEAGLTARLHAAIAERAGVSRPTVYKYVGDQNAIVEALLHREINRFLAATEPVLTQRGPLRERFIDTVVFIVQYGRGHAILQKGLRDDPAAVLPWFTVNSGPLIERAMDFFLPHIQQAIADGDFPAVDPRMLVEWSYRLIVSLVTTPSTLNVDEPEALGRFVGGLLDLGGAVGVSRYDLTNAALGD